MVHLPRYFRYDSALMETAETTLPGAFGNVYPCKSSCVYMDPPPIPLPDEQPGFAKALPPAATRVALTPGFPTLRTLKVLKPSPNPKP